MTEQARLSRLIAGIYDTALEPGRWPEVLARVVDFVGGQGGCLLAKDASSHDIEAHWHTGVAPHDMRLYTETYSKLGPLAALTSGDVGQVVCVADVMSYDEFRRSRFFREWAQPQGWVDVAIAAIEKSADRWSYLGISRNARSTGAAPATSRPPIARSRPPSLSMPSAAALVWTMRPCASSRNSPALR